MQTARARAQPSSPLVCKIAHAVSSVRVRLARSLRTTRHADGHGLAEVGTHEGRDGAATLMRLGRRRSLARCTLRAPNSFSFLQIGRRGVGE